MTMEQRNSQPNSKVQDQLLLMGFSAADIEHAFRAGYDEVASVVDFISQKEKHIDKIAYSDTVIGRTATSTTASPSQQRVSTSPLRGLTNARDSLDRIDVNHPKPPEDVVTIMSDDEKVRRALEISRQEQTERDMQKAIKLSQHENEAISRPEPDQDPELRRAIAESLQVDPRLGADDRNVSWQSHGYGDLQDRVRQTVDAPVGLRNIGNTCYLNSLLQVYFHLPDFRRAVMRFRAPSEFLEPQKDTFVATAAPGVSSRMNDIESLGAENETPEERLERHIHASQLDQSFGPAPDSQQNDIVLADTSRAPEKNNEESADSRAIRHAVQFVVELQKLFTAMALGNQNCADPSEVVRAMRDSEGNPIVIGTQQDASEFNHLFLDIVERGLRTESTDTHGVKALSCGNVTDFETSPPPVPMEEDEVSRNIVKDMFTVKFQQEVRTCTPGSDPENARNSPMTSSGETNSIIVDATTETDRDLHSGLGDYAQTRIEYKMSSSPRQERVADESGSMNSASPVSASHMSIPREKGADSTRATPAFKNVWFTHLPPVVVIYLQRVRYNRDAGKAEKVHDKFDFLSEISFDRYLAANKEASTIAKRKVEQIRAEKKCAAKKLRSIEFFPLGGLSNLVSQRNNLIGDSDHEMRHNAPTAVDSQFFQRRESVQTCTEESQGSHETLLSASRRICSRLHEALNPSSDLFRNDWISQESIQASINVLNGIAQQDKRKCEELRSELKILEDQEGTAYSNLDSNKYILHSVLVHDGAPSGGHYWTFIRELKSTQDKARWMKLSDSAVSYVSEAEMQDLSRGGRRTASAYCLIYAAKSSLQDSFRDFLLSISEESRNLLPDVRINEIDLASSEFAQQLQNVQGQKGKA